MIISIKLIVPIILMATLMSCWTGSLWLTTSLAFVTLGVGLFTGVLGFQALPVLVILFASGFWLGRNKNDALLFNLLAGGLFITLSVMLASHSLPGFNNVLVWSPQPVKVQSAPFTLFYNVDKPWVGLVILMACLPLLTSWRQWQSAFRKSVFPVLVMLPVVFSAGVFLGFVRWQPQWPEPGLWFLVNNLIFTALAEEAFFRGFIQKSLTDHLNRYSIHPFVAVVITALLFGLAHFAGGFVYVGLAALAGFFYGWIYYRSDSIEMATLSHWLLNACHFIFFSYPVAI